jgi:adenine deaminase
LVTPATLDRFMLVTDDKDVEDLLSEGHMDHLIRRAIAGGLNPVHAVKLATHNTARYFRLRELGAIAPGRLACIAVLENLEQCRVTQVYQAGRLVAQDGVAVEIDEPERRRHILRSSINVHWLEPDQFAIKAPQGDECRVHVIEVTEGRIDTERAIEAMPVVGGSIHADPQRDLCKIAVIERHQASGNMGLGFVRGFGLTAGAIASSVCHDSHNLVVAGTNDHDMYTAAVQLVKMRGGFCVVRDGKVLAEVPLPIAGLMSEADAPTLNHQLEALHKAAQSLNTKLRRPFMAMSFLNLSVIGSLKITDQGLIDVDRFELIDLVAS